jgi:hypothetical protein
MFVRNFFKTPRLFMLKLSTFLGGDKPDKVSTFEQPGQGAIDK